VKNLSPFPTFTDSWSLPASISTMAEMGFPSRVLADVPVRATLWLPVEPSRVRRGLCPGTGRPTLSGWRGYRRPRDLETIMMSVFTATSC